MQGIELEFAKIVGKSIAKRWILQNQNRRQSTYKAPSKPPAIESNAVDNAFVGKKHNETAL